MRERAKKQEAIDMSPADRDKLLERMEEMRKAGKDTSKIQRAIDETDFSKAHRTPHVHCIGGRTYMSTGSVRVADFEDKE